MKPTDLKDQLEQMLFHLNEAKTICLNLHDYDLVSNIHLASKAVKKKISAVWADVIIDELKEDKTK